MQGTVTYVNGSPQFEICASVGRYRIWREKGRIKCIEIYTQKKINHLGDLPSDIIGFAQMAVNSFYPSFGAPLASVDPTEGNKFRIGNLDSCVDCSNFAS